MKEIKITTAIIEKDYEELDSEQLQLIDAAREATYRAYAPYSHFSVGAAIRLDGGKIVTGSNQENAAYPSGLCAERTAAFYANSENPDIPFQSIAIAARDTNGEFCAVPISPCGACRQVLLEYEKLAGHKVSVLLAGKDRVYILPSIESLLPFAFADFR